MARDQTKLLPGTPDMVILKSLALAEIYGLGISHRIDQITTGAFQVKPGSLFEALGPYCASSYTGARNLLKETPWDFVT